ncbi:hypothetical protein BOX15_Mlig008451g2 [Macrostomum lignano]|uniref:RING-type domain-containing protein n=2 Tax=Macrostomum lignano TaxID=282301 RepID=A0A267F324_9PLAT|nr:hypothetical protein BOX15_Mlig008451g2 [Macrostomum lignano]
MSESSMAVECRLCNEGFDMQGDLLPRLLACGHSVCHRCLRQLPVLQHHDGGGPGGCLLCPFDRQPTPLPEAGVWGLKKNFALLEQLERLAVSSDSAVGASGGGDANSASATSGSGASSSTAAASPPPQPPSPPSVPCDENDSHTAELHCLVCSSNLCPDCARTTHSSRTLSQHSLVPVGQRPARIPRCRYHPMHAAELVCLEEACWRNSLMCYICKDYGRHVGHRHALLESELESVRSGLSASLSSVRAFAADLNEAARRLRACAEEIDRSETGTRAVAERQVEEYFEVLAKRVQQQRQAARTALQAHVQQRLSCVNTQLEQLADLLNGVTSATEQLSGALALPDLELLAAKPELAAAALTVAKQQADCADTLARLAPDASVPLTFTRDHRLHIGPKLEMRAVLLGLDGAGKTSILFRLKQNEFVSAVPTIGFNVETIECDNVKLTYWDVGGSPKLRPLWRHYYLNTQCLVFVIDSCDSARLEEAFNELTKLLQEPELKEASFLILANKQSSPGAITIETLMERFQLVKLCSTRSWHIQSCDAMTGQGLPEAVDWLSHQLVAACPAAEETADYSSHDGAVAPSGDAVDSAAARATEASADGQQQQQQQQEDAIDSSNNGGGPLASPGLEYDA